MEPMIKETIVFSWQESLPGMLWYGRVPPDTYTLPYLTSYILQVSFLYSTISYFTQRKDHKKDPKRAAKSSQQKKFFKF